MGLRSVVLFISWPFKAAWRTKNHFLPPETPNISPPTIIKKKSEEKKEETSPLPISPPESPFEPPEPIIEHDEELNTDETPSTPSTIGFSINAPADRIFHLYGGHTIWNLADLEESLTDMDQEIFQHHVNDSHNDFANWVRDVFSFPELANALSNAHTSEEAHDILKEFKKRK